MAPKSTKEHTNLVSDGKVIDTTAAMFGEAVLSMPDGEPAVYAPRRGEDGPSTKLAKYSVPLNLVGGETLTIENNIYAALQKDGKLNIRVSLPAKLRASKDMRSEFKRHINIALIRWPWYRKAGLAAGELLKNPPKPKTKAETSADDVTDSDLTFDMGGLAHAASEPVATTA